MRLARQLNRDQAAVAHVPECTDHRGEVDLPVAELEMLVNTCLNTGSSCLGVTDANFKSRTGASVEAPAVP